MTYSEIHGKIRFILDKKMKVFMKSPSYTANFYDDFGLSKYELNWLLYNVEDHFDIRLENGLEERLSTINELVAMVHKAQNSKLS